MDLLIFKCQLFEMIKNCFIKKLRGNHKYNKIRFRNFFISDFIMIGVKSCVNTRSINNLETIPLKCLTLIRTYSSRSF